LPGRPPTSSIQLAAASRTIVHYRDLPELTAKQFAAIELAPFDWIHFEGRNVPELLKMLARVRKMRPGLSVSLELEKPRAGIEVALDQPDVLICLRGYARHCGHEEPLDFLDWLHRRSPQAHAVMAWGEAGAYGLSRQGQGSHSPAFAPPRIVDTLGAGDTFNAGLIGALAEGESLVRALGKGCRLAGKECGVFGFLLHSEGAASTAQ
jgi:ketohexokinase